MQGEEQEVVPPPHHSSVMKRLTDAETELLISLVQRRPCLWSETHPDFKNAGLRRKLWKGIAGHLHITGDEAKCKWKNLKDKFRKLRHIQEEKSAAGISPSEPKWRFYNSLLFTKDNPSISENANGNVIKTEAESDNCVSGDSNDSSSFSSDVDVDFEIDVPSADKSTSRDLAVIPSPSVQQNQRDRDFQIGNRGTKRKKSNISESNKTEEEEMRNAPSKSQDDSNRHDDYHFLMSLLPYIEVLEPLDKLELRFGIQKLVTDSFKKHVSKKGSRFRQQPTGKQNEY